MAPIKPLNRTQADYIEAIAANDMVVALGALGSGKTFIPSVIAAGMLRANDIKKIVVIRPNVPCSRSLGALPGDLVSKFTPWAAPILDTLRSRMGRGAFDCAMKSGMEPGSDRGIELVPIEYIRGRTFDGCFVILDEAENCNVTEIVAVLGRIGNNSKIIVAGDLAQTDIREANGLAKIVTIIKQQGLPYPVIEFVEDDIVRSDLCRAWARAFRRAGL